MKNIFTCLACGLLLTLASSCSKKEAEVAPLSSGIRAYSANATGDSSFEIGRRLGASDALHLAKQYSIPCPGGGGDGNTPFPSPEPGPYDYVPAPNDRDLYGSPPLQGQGYNSFCMDGRDEITFQNTLASWKQSALDHADAAAGAFDSDQQEYYMGYAQGVYEWQMPAR